MTIPFRPTDVHIIHHPQRHSVPLAADHGDLVGILAGAAPAPDIAMIPVGTAVIVLDDAVTVLHVEIAGDAGRRLRGWLPAAWTRPILADVA
jgi:hypothetical protein